MDRSPEPRQAMIHRAFTRQAEICRKMGSPFTAQVLDSLVLVLDRDTNFGRAVLNWAGDPDALHDALPLRVSAAFHALANAGRDAGLSSMYPPHPQPSGVALRDGLRRTIVEQGDWLMPWLRHTPQTNEVGRSAGLYLGLMQVAERFGLPIRLFEIGSSAGLNLNLDRYGYTFAGQRDGDFNSPLQLSPEWKGSTRVGRTPQIVERRGSDLAPFNLALVEERERLKSYIWPDQQARLDRLQAALSIAERYPPPVEQADASDWVSVMALPKNDGVATVLMHSAFWTYISEEGQRAIRGHMEQIARTAT